MPGAYGLTRLILAAVVAGGMSSPALAGGDIVGPARVIDGDTLEVRGQRIRLHGIDAPESGQTCRADGKTWRCGRKAAFALTDKIGRAPVTCEERDRDRYGRIVAKCSVGGKDLGEWMVLRGWALAYRQYSTAYVDEEAAAQAAAVGMWRGEFIPPWEWRRGKRLASQAAPQPMGCLVKGNINRKGERIYHVPSSRWYDRTKIDLSKGERWFCTEEDAQKAGWRAPKR